jgi:hypothetical protein
MITGELQIANCKLQIQLPGAASLSALQTRTYLPYLPNA